MNIKPAFPKSGYKKFCQEQNKKLKTDIPREKLGLMWDALSEPQKKNYDGLFKEKRADYDQEFSEWRQLNPSQFALKKQRLKEANKQDPTSGYMKFTIEARDQHKGPISLKELANMWKKLTSEEKQSYNDDVKILKDEQKAQENNQLQKLQEDLGIVEKPKQPQSAYLRFCKQIRESTDEKISLKDLGAKWQQLAENRKEELNVEFKSEMEMYKIALEEWKEKHENTEENEEKELKRRRPPIKQRRLEEDEAFSEKPRKSIKNKNFLESLSEKKWNELQKLKPMKIAKNLSH